MSAIRDNVAGILETIHKLRPHEAVRLMAVCKGRSRDEGLAAIEAGAHLIGENRVQEARAKWPEKFGIDLHLIGHLQTNKVKYATQIFDAIDSVDSERVADAIARVVSPAPRPVMVEVNPGREPERTGFFPEHIRPFLEQAGTKASLQWVGLLAVLPVAKDGSGEEHQRIRQLMQETAELWRMCRAEGWPWAPMQDLSMGMSSDYAWALEAGATMIRIGSGIFGEYQHQH